PLPHSANRYVGENQQGLLPRWSGSGTEYGEGREGARAKRARSIDGFGTAPYPAAASGDPFPLSLRSRGTKLRGGEIQSESRSMGLLPGGTAAEPSTAKAGRGRERSEPSQPPSVPCSLAAAPPRP